MPFPRDEWNSVQLRHATAMVRFMLNAWIALLLTFAVARTVNPDPASGRLPLASVLAAALALAVVLRIVASRGHARLIGRVMAILMLALISGAVVALGTVRTPGITVFVLNIAFSAPLGRRFMWFMVGCSAAALAALHLAERHGMLPPPSFHVGFNQWLTLAIALIFTGGIMHILVRTQRDAFVETQRELDERRRAQEALNALNRELEARVAERTAAAEAASRAKSDFLARVSHELRTPLNGILGYSEYLCDHAASEAHREHARTIHAAGQHLLQLVNELLDMARIDGGTIRASIRPIPLAPLLREIAGLHAASARGKGLALRLEPAADLPAQIHSDPTRLRQILNNLCHNAVKFTDAGEVVLAAAGDPAAVVFEVRDTGRGIAAERLPLIFEGFRRGANETEPDAGAGLGLAIAKALTEMLGGRIEAESAPGRGSRFRVRLPAAAPREAQAGT